jgi:hypothetical protein
MSESMQESMEREIAEAIRLMEKANTALSRLFNTDEGEDDSISWGELAELTHATQVQRFGWCMCEDPDQGQLAEDCPKREGE